MTLSRVRVAGGWTAFGLVLASALACASTSHPPVAGVVTPALELHEGASVDAVVNPGSPQVYPLPLAEGTYFEIHVDRPPNDLDLHVFEPAASSEQGSQEPYVSGEVSADPPGQMVWEVARSAGEHRLHLEARGGEPVRYRLTVTELRPATARDRSRHRGLEVYNEARQLQGEGRTEEALEQLLEARELFVRGEYERGIAATFSFRGRILQSLKRFDRARTDYRKAIEHWHRGGDRSAVANTLVSLAGLERETSHWDLAETYLARALELARKAYAHRAESNCLAEYCTLYTEDGRYERAIETCNHAVALKKELERPGEAVGALINLASLYRFRGEIDSARSYLLQAQDILSRHPNRQLAATMRNEMAILLDFEGEYLEALSHYQEARESYEALGERSYAGLMLFNMGTIYQRLGDIDSTLEYYRQALALTEGPGASVLRIHVLDGLGWVHIQRGDLQNAEAVLTEALEESRSLDSPPLVASALERFGELHVANGQPREAIEALDEALELHRASGSRWREPSILVQLARARAALGDRERTLDLLFQAVAIYEDIGKRSAVAETHHRIASFEREWGDLEAARRAIEQAVAVADSLRLQVGSDDLRTLFSSTTRPYFELYIDILMEQHWRQPEAGHDAEALRESERARAQSLLEILPESDLDLGEEVPEELLTERASIRHRLNAKEIERQNLLKSESADAGALFRMKLDLEGLLTDLQEVERKIRASSPRYAALTRPQPVTVGEIQRSLLDAETALLEYSLGEERSYLWVVTERAFRTYELPGRREIEEAARCVHWLITVYGQPPDPAELADEDAECFEDGGSSYRSRPPGGDALEDRIHRRRVIRTAFDGLAAGLSRTLLAPPARDGLLTHRLALVSDGALEYVPFAALPRPLAGGAPLVVDHELVRLPSASVLAFQRNQPVAGGEPAGELAIVADPVYNLSDRRIRSPAGASERRERPVPVARSGLQQTPEYSRLAFSGREATAIAAFAPPEKTLVACGFDASRETVTRGALSGYRYVHFATHGVIDTRYPQLSGLVLSLVDRTGAAEGDGFLRLHDIYGLELDDTDMVVLSACETALGREVRGEGLVGLTRGFLYAGAERVVASLWPVQDLATADLMEDLYRGLLEEGRSPADALRRAQLGFLGPGRESRAFPYFWAGFVLQGEWR